MTSTTETGSWRFWLLNLYDYLVRVDSVVAGLDTYDLLVVD